MLKLEDIRAGAALSGVEAGQVVKVVATEVVGPDSLTLYYRTAQGDVKERLLFRSHEAELGIAAAGRPWSFEAPGEDFKLATEALRIDMAYLFDPMMAVHTSNVEPLPHQITAVYESMLPRQPLRFVLADDPGAGKTIMAGLLIRELIMRADAQRILIVAPGGLVEQWQDELFEKFGLNFDIFSREMMQDVHNGNPFDNRDRLLVRLDQLSRNEDLIEKIRLTQWDLVVVDEAHKMSARWYGNKVNETQRFKLGRILGGLTRHFLLMTATPHNGKEEDFQYFLSLLDSDRFYGRQRDGAHKVDVTDLMRRMIKEEIVKFDGTPLFPPRKAHTAKYELSGLEAALYESVTNYVRTEMNKADNIQDGKRKGTVGFALTGLQRRLASSPEAIYQSLRRRRAKLSQRIEEEKLRQRGQLNIPSVFDDVPEDIWESSEEMGSDRYEELEEEVVDQATAAQTIQELEAEVIILQGLEEQARELVHSGQDRKWDELSKILQDRPEMRDSEGRQRKLIIFTEHRDTLNYLTRRIRGLVGSEEAVVTIHGGVKREERRGVQESFRNIAEVRILVATDAAGEGVNLQNANLMVNYDLPWNPNRLEQRFGRIHRIGQTEVCYLWNLVAAGTREGDVFIRLLEKLDNERESLSGRVFDILGEVFEERSLRDLLIEAIRKGEDPNVRAELERAVDIALDPEHVRRLLERHALCKEVMSPERLFKVREEMEKAEARKLQPYFIRAFFSRAFAQLEGELRTREEGRWEIAHVPAIIRERDRQLTGRDRRNPQPVVRKYERVCFEKQYSRVPGRASSVLAELIHPGHPLMQAVTDITLERHRTKLKQGAILVDPNDPGIIPKVLVLIDHAVRESYDANRLVSRRLQFVEIDPEGNATHAGWAPHLDLLPIDQADRPIVDDILQAPWLTQEMETRAMAYASANLVEEHFKEVQDRRTEHVEKTLQAVHERLVREISHWQNRYLKLEEDKQAGKDVALNLDNIRRTLDDLQARLQQRTAELNAMRHVVAATPVVLGGTLVIPAGLLMQRKGQSGWSADAAARARVERIAMETVMAHERAQGCTVVDVSAQKCGWDVTSIPPDVDGQIPPSRHIEVKGRAKGQDTITVTRNEILYALNQADKFILGIVIVDGDTADGPHYVRRPFTQEPDWAVTSINLDLGQLARLPQLFS